MAGLLRRLALLSARLGVQPQLILSSATVSDPLDLAARLTARPAAGFSLIDEHSDGSQQAIKHWSVLSPIAASHMAARPYLSAAALAMVDLLCATDEYGTPRPVNTVLFARSMKDVHAAYEIVRRNLEHRRPDLLPKVRKCIGAELKPDDKRQIYEGLKHGTYVGVISTNALEAGVDSGELRACIFAGFPYTVMRMRQMAGRVGRKGEGLVIFVRIRPVEWTPSTAKTRSAC
ncbi:MAG: hypothetical protein HC822_03690 [Oscillochloris sp.]|nr:hypothetical protein [Oscillochloris sp.]